MWPHLLSNYIQRRSRFATRLLARHALLKRSETGAALRAGRSFDHTPLFRRVSDSLPRRQIAIDAPDMLAPVIEATRTIEQADFDRQIVPSGHASPSDEHTEYEAVRAVEAADRDTHGSLPVGLAAPTDKPSEQPGRLPQTRTEPLRTPAFAPSQPPTRRREIDGALHGEHTRAAAMRQPRFDDDMTGTVPVGGASEPATPVEALPGAVADEQPFSATRPALERRESAAPHTETTNPSAPSTIHPSGAAGHAEVSAVVARRDVQPTQPVATQSPAAEAGAMPRAQGVAPESPQTQPPHSAQDMALPERAASEAEQPNTSEYRPAPAVSDHAPHAPGSETNAFVAAPQERATNAGSVAGARAAAGPNARHPYAQVFQPTTDLSAGFSGPAELTLASDQPAPAAELSPHPLVEPTLNKPAAPVEQPRQAPVEPTLNKPAAPVEQPRQASVEPTPNEPTATTNQPRDTTGTPAAPARKMSAPQVEPTNAPLPVDAAVENIELGALTVPTAEPSDGRRRAIPDKATPAPELSDGRVVAPRGDTAPGVDAALPEPEQDLGVQANDWMVERPAPPVSAPAPEAAAINPATHPSALDADVASNNVPNLRLPDRQIDSSAHRLAENRQADAPPRQASGQVQHPTIAPGRPAVFDAPAQPPPTSSETPANDRDEPLRRADSMPDAGADVFPAPQSASAASASAPAAHPSRMPRSARFTEGLTPSQPALPTPPPRPPRKPVQSEEAAQRAAAIFTSETPERDVREWGRLLFAATNTDDIADAAQEADASEESSLPEDGDEAAPHDMPAHAALSSPVRQATHAAGHSGERLPEASPPRVTTPSAPAQTPRPAWPAAQPVSPRLSTEQPQITPTPLSDSARRFLQPVVGIDPAGVRFYHGAQADQIAASQAADGLTVGDSVWLAAGHNDESPESLGLLAHELTHVARRREPRFVPPMVHDATGHVTNEESLAGSVEARTVRAARVRQRQAFPAPALVAEARTRNSTMSENAQFTPAHNNRTLPDGSASSAVWGELPAPWEPLPVWASQPSVEPGAAPASMSSAAVSTSSAPVAGGGGDAAAPAAQAASIDRSMADIPREEHRADAAPNQPEEAPPLDLDMLAQHVYGMVKRRLATERRRFG